MPSDAHHAIQLAGEAVLLLGDRALFWPGGGTLFIADPHFGKSAGMRFAGIAAPEVIEGELDRLSQLLQSTGAGRLVVLGDFFHGRMGRTPSVMTALEVWRSKQVPDIEIVLIRGNHDLSAGDPPAELRIQCVNEPWTIGPFLGCHEPAFYEHGFALAGHWHPGVRLDDRNGASLKCPVFVAGPGICILPAFGTYTGLEIVRRRPGHRYYLVGEETVHLLPEVPDRIEG